MSRIVSRGSALVLCLLAALPTLARSQQVDREEEREEFEGGDVLRRRFEYFQQQRQFPFDRMPSRPTRASLLRSRRPMGGPLFDRIVGSSASDWTSLGPRPIDGFQKNAGRVTAIAIDPRDPRIIYVGGAQGGVWKSTDRGTTWRPLTDQACSLAVGAITLDPVNPDIIYVGTGEANFSGDSWYGCGVLRSADAGDSWTQLGATIFDTPSGGATVSRIVVDPRSAGTITTTTILAATNMGLFRSTNAGATWTRVLFVGYGHVTDVVADPMSPATVYAAGTSVWTNADNGIYKSTDGGATFARLTSFPASAVGRIALTTVPGEGGTVWAAVESSANGSLLGVYRTTDAGGSWPQVATSASSVPCNGQCWYDLTIGVSPADPTRVYVGTVQLYRSGDGGATYTAVSGGMHVDQHAIAFDPADPAVVYSGNDGGIYRSGDGGSTWTSLNQDLAITQFYAGVSIADAALQVLAGTQDNGTLQYSGTSLWASVLGGDGGYTATRPGAAFTQFAETQYIASSGYSGPRRRDATNAGFGLKANGIDLSEPGLFIAPLVIDRARPDVLYFGTRSLSRTTNGGESWTRVLQLGAGSVSAIAPSLSDSNTVYVGATDGSLLVTRDGGATWTSRITGLATRFVTDIIVNHGDPRLAYATQSGFGTGHVWRTIDGGASWTNISGNLPDVPVNAIVQLPGGELDIGTDIGVFRSGQDGGTWTPSISGLPNVAVVDLVYHQGTSTLVAATHGRGMFGSTITVTPAPAMLTVDAQPKGASSGATLGQFAVSVREAAGDLLPNATTVVTATMATDSGTLVGTTTVTAVNGVARFDDLALVGAGTYALSFSAAGLRGAESAPLVISPATVLLLAPAHRHVAVVAGAAATDSLVVSLTGPGADSLAWSATASHPWTSLTTSAGVGTATLRWSRTTTGLAAGVYVDTITVAAPPATGSPARYADTLTVLDHAPTTIADFSPDTLVGSIGLGGVTDLRLDMGGAAPLGLGPVVATVGWDSTVVRLDSVSAGSIGAVAVTRPNAGTVRLRAAGGGAMNVVDVAALHFSFVGATLHATTPVLASFDTVASVNPAMDLLPGLTTRAAVVRIDNALRGDVDDDGAVTAADADLILRVVAGMALPPGAKLLPNADANCDARVTALDAQLVLAFVRGRPTGGTCVGTVR